MQIRRKSVYREAAPVKEKNRFFFPFSSCDVKMVGEEIIRRARREGGEKKKQQKENKLERREDQCIYTIHL